jgi:hypothetical protein
MLGSDPPMDLYSDPLTQGQTSSTVPPLLYWLPEHHHEPEPTRHRDPVSTSLTPLTGSVTRPGAATPVQRFWPGCEAQLRGFLCHEFG